MFQLRKDSNKRFAISNRPVVSGICDYQAIFIMNPSKLETQLKAEESKFKLATAWHKLVNLSTLNPPNLSHLAAWWFKCLLLCGRCLQFSPSFDHWNLFSLGNF